MDVNDDLNALALAARALHRDFLVSVEPHRPALWRYCLRLTGSPWDAEDLVQETLLRAMGRLALSWQPIEPRRYLFRVATNAWIDARRRSRTEARLDDEEEREAADGIGGGTEESVAALDYLAATLPPRQAVVVLLADVFDFRIGEIAEMLTTTSAAVKGSLQRARQTLRMRRTEAPEAPTARRTAAQNELTARYLDAFNRRDPDAIAALLHGDAFIEIVGVGDQRGRAVARADSLRQWAADPLPQWAEAGEYAEEAVVFVFVRDDDGVEQLHRITRFRAPENVILRSWEYFMAPELLTMAAQALHVAVDTHGYMFDVLE